MRAVLARDDDRLALRKRDLLRELADAQLRPLEIGDQRKRSVRRGLRAA